MSGGTGHFRVTTRICRNKNRPKGKEKQMPKSKPSAALLRQQLLPRNCDNPAVCEMIRTMSDEQILFACQRYTKQEGPCGE
jgi:hypothetical protein